MAQQVFDQVPFIEHTANGLTGVFAFNFQVLEAADLAVYRDGVLVPASDYVLAGLGVAAGGTVTFTVNPAAGVKVLLSREISLQRLTEYQTLGDFKAVTVNPDFNRIWMAVQGLNARLGGALRLPFPEQGDELPGFAERAGKILAFDAQGVPSLIVGVDSGSAAALDLSLRDATNALKGAGQINYGASILYLTGVGAELWQVINLATWPGVDRTGATECGAAIRLAMAEAVASNRPLVVNSGTYVTAHDPASLSGGFYGWSLKIPSNLVLIKESGATIKQANGVQSWTRTVSFQDAQNVKVFGCLKVDANVAGRGATTNEHMHGVFIFNSKHLYIEAIDSRNARGDNVFIGGTDETTFGEHIKIGHIYAEKAGRKNLVLHYAQCDIDTADLDNTTGGASVFGGTPDDTDKHSLDVEPDAYTGTKRFVQRIGKLRTRGLGNDFGAGTTPAEADNWVVSGDDWECTITGPSATVPAWQQTGVTINVANIKIMGCAGIDSPVTLSYAARLSGNVLVIEGATATATGALLLAAPAGTDENKPKIDFARVELRNTVGRGADIRSALLDIDTLDAETVGEALVAGESVSSTSLRGGALIGNLVTRDTGTPTTGAVVKVQSYSTGGYALTIRRATIIDTRASKVGYLAEVGNSNASGLCIGEVVNPESVQICNWLGTDKYYRLAGGPWSTTARSPGVYVCRGTPEAMIPAPVGSLAMRDDGGAGTSLYVKQAGASTTGWVGK